MSVNRTQCLLFIVHETNDKATRKLRNSATGRLRSAAAAVPSAPKGYALFPEVFKEKRPEVLQRFAQNNIQVLSNQNISSFSLVQDDKLEIMELLLDESPSASLDPLSALTCQTNREVVNLLFCNITVCGGSSHGVIGVRPAVDDKNLHVIRHILDQKANVFCRDGGESLLHLAAKRGPESLVKFVLERSGNIEVRRRDAATPLHLAAESGLATIAQLLLERGANIQAQRRDGATPLHLAAKSGLVPIVSLLIRNGATVNVKDNFGHSALYVATVQGHLDVVETLLHNGADVNSQSNTHRTPIISAASKGHFELVEMLFKYGAQVGVKDKYNRSVLSDTYGAKCPTKFQHYLESYFLDLELLKETSVIAEFLEIVGRYRERWYWYFNEVASTNFKTCRDILARHIVKITVLHLYHIVDEVNVTLLWADSHQKSLGDFQVQCQEEVDRMKTLKVGDTDVTFYGVLAEDATKVACYLRNNSVAQIAAPSKLQLKFPIYGSILAHHFQKGKEKKSLHEECIKICNFLFTHFKRLPHEIKERILGYLSTKDSLVLKKACGRLNVSP